MSVLRRLYQITRPYHGNLLAGLLLILFTTILDSTVLVSLLGFIAFLVTNLSPTGAAGGGEPAKEATGILANPRVQEVLAHVKTVLPDLNNLAGTPEQRFRLLIIMSLITAAVVLVKCALTARQSYLIYKFSNEVARDLRQRLFDHILRLSPSNLEHASTGAHLSRITNDVGVLQTCLGPQLIHAVQAPLAVALALTYIVLLSWQLTLAVLCMTPVIFFAIITATGRIRRYAHRIQESVSTVNATLLERLSNVRVIQSFVREPNESERVAASINQNFRNIMRGVFWMETLGPTIEFIAFMGMIVGVVVGGMQVYRGEMAPWVFFAFILQAQKAGAAFRTLSRVTQTRQQIEAVGTRLFSILDEQPAIQDAPHAVPLARVDGAIRFEGVAFRYATGQPVLAEIDLDVAPGEIIALVGPSGAGKTTLVNLLPRFYDPTEGRILIDGVDLRAVTLASLRRQIGIVPQETTLFSGTIADNIRYGCLEAEEAEVIEAARAANALEFIERLPDGFDTLVGERGARLSGGQRQRVAIARAVLKNPRILILDEATSALDTASEHLVQQALEHLMVGRTTFVIAHRLSTVQNATRILVLDRGRIREQGAHLALLQQGGLYQRLYEMQFHAPAPDTAPAS